MSPRRPAGSAEDGWCISVWPIPSRNVIWLLVVLPDGFLATMHYANAADLQHLRDGLQDGHAPRRLAEGNRPVQRRWPPVTLDARVHDEAGVPLPDRPWNGLLEHRRDDEVRLVDFDRRAHGLVAGRQMDRNPMAAVGELNLQALAQAVVSARDEQDSHVPAPPVRDRVEQVGSWTWRQQLGGSRSPATRVQKR